MFCLLDLLQRLLRHSGIGGPAEMKSTTPEVYTHVNGVVGEVYMQVTAEAISTAWIQADMASLREESALEFCIVTLHELVGELSHQRQQNQNLQVRVVRESEREEDIEELDRLEWERLHRAPRLEDPRPSAGGLVSKSPNGYGPDQMATEWADFGDNNFCIIVTEMVYRQYGEPGMSSGIPI